MILTDTPQNKLFKSRKLKKHQSRKLKIPKNGYRTMEVQIFMTYRFLGQLLIQTTFFTLKDAQKTLLVLERTNKLTKGIMYS